MFKRKHRLIGMNNIFSKHDVICQKLLVFFHVIGFLYYNSKRLKIKDNSGNWLFFYFKLNFGSHKKLRIHSQNFVWADTVDILRNFGRKKVIFSTYVFVVSSIFLKHIVFWISPSKKRESALVFSQSYPGLSTNKDKIVLFFCLYMRMCIFWTLKVN
jgi:hypothetical protein